MDQAIRSFVRSPHLRQLLGRFATYVGGSPYLAPATLKRDRRCGAKRRGLLPARRDLRHCARRWGSWRRSGGADRDRARGAGDRGNRDGRAAGLVLEDGTAVAGKAVISNVDVSTIHPSPPPWLAEPPLMNPPAPALPCCWGGKEHPQLAHHNIFFSNDYPAEFDAIFKQGIPPADPTIYVAITAKTDPDHAPAGCENWFVLVNAPPLGDHYDWQRQKTAYPRPGAGEIGRARGGYSRMRFGTSGFSPRTIWRPGAAPGAARCTARRRTTVSPLSPRPTARRMCAGSISPAARPIPAAGCRW
jgi:hypothetical protein